MHVFIAAEKADVAILLPGFGHPVQEDESFDNKNHRPFDFNFQPLGVWILCQFILNSEPRRSHNTVVSHLGSLDKQSVGILTHSLGPAVTTWV